MWVGQGRVLNDALCYLLAFTLHQGCKFYGVTA